MKSKKRIALFIERAEDLDYLGEALTILTESEHDISIIGRKKSLHQLDLPTNVQLVKASNWLHLSFLFLTSRYDYVIMTTPDLESFYLKRSRVYPTRYIYYFHSLISSHYAYREKAFDYFDFILCTGPHHLREIRRREKEKGLSRKHLVQFGYPILEKLKTGKVDPDTILIAPSWNSFLAEPENLRRLLESIKEFSNIKIRLHPKTPESHKRKISNWATRNENWQLSKDSLHQDLQKASLLISDWSGISFEFGLALRRPVLFIDEGEKRMDQHKVIHQPPIELQWRELFGEKLNYSQLCEAPELINRLLKNSSCGKNYNSDLVYEFSPNTLLEIL